jgi:Family of unknown function (DUF6527)
MKIRVLKFRRTQEGPIEIHMGYQCPGCGYEHIFSPNVHRFNNDLANPTVQPSLLHSNPQNYHTCHSYITDGKIQFLGDCWHELKNQTVELPEWSDEMFNEYADIN